MKSRGRWQGMWTIVSFNWPFYLVALIVVILSLGTFISHSEILLRILSGLTLAGALYFLVGSLGVSHQVYDRSDLYRWQWLARAMEGAGRSQMVFCHSGFDESSQEVFERLNPDRWIVLDHYDAAQMTEASIQRARRKFPPTRATLPAPFEQWPVETHSTDVVLGILAIHELRSENERIAWFAEARRCLASGGRLVLVEHIRDLANFLAFGPGFLHFHSTSSWRRCWEHADFILKEEFKITPWVSVFVIEAK
jgi:SAM-dependent methyltransferase